MPDTKTHPILAAATTHLADAQEAAARGDYREEVGLCRDSLEALTAALGDRDDQDSLFQPIFEKSRTFNKAARVRLLRRAAKVLTHPARHADGDAARIEWNRLDAQTILSIVATLVQLASSASAVPKAEE